MALNKLTAIDAVSVMRTMGWSKLDPGVAIFTDDALLELADVLTDTWDTLSPHHRFVLLGIGSLIAAQQRRELEAADLADGLINQLWNGGRHD